MIEADTLTYPVINLSPWLKPKGNGYPRLAVVLAAVVQLAVVASMPPSGVTSVVARRAAGGSPP